jgi:hypothetical protein
MKRLNVVYANMRESRFEIPLPDLDAEVIWTRREESGSDIVLYMNGYSYDPKAVATNPFAFRMLYIYEPLVVWPRQFLSSFWTPFDVILTWSRALVEQGGKFHYFPTVYYDFPFGAMHGFASQATFPDDWQNRRRAIVQVAGNKYSFMSSELYSRRRTIAKWFNRHGRTPLDTYGQPPMSVPGYRGRSPDKMVTFSGYRFALCTENESHSIWSRGYVTEKIFDCFYAFTVPIYLGAADIEEHVPADCFIDLRRFSSLKELDAYLQDMSDEVFFGYLQAIAKFLQAYQAPTRHSCYNLYETAIRIAGQPVAETINPAFGFWEKASTAEKARCLLMRGALPVHKAIFGSRYAGTR